ncbi:interleukin-18 receptor 1-like [Leuresthes tenuis]|uniref:interleukin-18 receptor 1-like n=1 Tax=Leuresthes tenuis TaxID=355514 RepID=UPI003B513F99
MCKANTLQGAGKQILHALTKFNLLFSFAGVCPLNLTEIYVKAGEIVVLCCNDTETLWKKDTNQYISNQMSEVEQKRMGVAVHGNCLVIPRASVNHQGNYTCYSNRNTSRETRLTVYTSQSKENKGRGQYLQKCYTQESCTLYCPEDKIPAADTLNITLRDITWIKDDEPSKQYFRSVEKNNSGNYTCTRSYVYDGEIYHRSMRVQLDVQPGKPERYVTINSPQDGDVFQVELGTTVVIDCSATINACDESLFWLHVAPSRKSKGRVFYNLTCNKDTRKMTSSLVFTEVFAEDLSKNFTCKLEDDSNPAQLVNITLTKKPLHSYISLVQCVISIVVVTAVTAVIYVKFKIDITLFFRDTLGCRRRTSDGKSYDAFLMSYMSDAHGGLNEDDREWLESTLEERFGYCLCLYDRDVLPGDAVAEAVLNCVEQSRTVVLVPSSQASEQGSGLLSAIHAALVERHTRLIFINTEQTEMSRSGSLAETLHLLSETGHCVTWKGRQPSSTFWKQLRYNLPAPQSVGSHLLFNVL